VLAGVGCSIHPVPPAQSGTTWERDTILQGSAPHAFDTPRGRFVLLRNVRDHWQTRSSSFRYRVELTIDAPSGREVVRCEHRRDDSYVCTGSELLELRLSEDCSSGEVQTPAGTATLEPWLVRDDGSTAEPWATGETHVGFRLRRRDRWLAAFDTDDAWYRVVWVDSEVSDQERRSIDALGVLLDDLIEAGSEYVGPTLRPMLCDRLVTLRRHPR
jgi:hypothetical protein